MWWPHVVLECRRLTTHKSTYLCQVTIQFMYVSILCINLPSRMCQYPHAGALIVCECSVSIHTLHGYLCVHNYDDCMHVHMYACTHHTHMHACASCVYSPNVFYKGVPVHHSKGQTTPTCDSSCSVV